MRRLQSGWQLIAIGLVDRYQIGNLQDTSFHALKGVSRTRNQHKQQRINHFPDPEFGLPYAYCFHNDDVVPGSLAKRYSLPGSR